MVSLSSKSPLGKICRLCKEKKDLNCFRNQGAFVSPVCLICETSLPSIPYGSGDKRCGMCLAVKKLKEFYRSGNSYHSYCKACNSEWRKSRYDSDKTRDRYLRATYNITLEEYNILFFQQGGLCAVCSQPETVIDPYTKQVKYLAVDHNHKTDKVRQLLCSDCNTLLGVLEKDPNRVKLLVKYLKKHQM